MTLNRVKLGCIVTFMKYIASVVSFLIYLLPKTLNWNKITVSVLNLLNLAELVRSERIKSISKKCKDFKSL